jgi:hypothetical protein
VDRCRHRHCLGPRRLRQQRCRFALGWRPMVGWRYRSLVSRVTSADKSRTSRARPGCAALGGTNLYALPIIARVLRSLRESKAALLPYPDGVVRDTGYGLRRTPFLGTRENRSWAGAPTSHNWLLMPARRRSERACRESRHGIRRGLIGGRR